MISLYRQWSLAAVFGLMCAGIWAAVPEPAAAVGEADHETIDRLIVQLGSREYVTRHRAEQQLIHLGQAAIDALMLAERHPDVEIASRAAYLARKITVDWVSDADSAAVKDLMRDYAKLSDAKKLQSATNLAAVPDDAGVGALCRIVRYELSSLLSKRVAVLLLESASEEGNEKRRARLLDAELGSSKRPACNWLRADLLAQTDPQAALLRWDELIADERGVLETSADASETSIVVALMRQKVELLRAMDRSQQAIALMYEMIELEAGDVKTLSDLVDWLVEQQDWAQLDDIGQRFSEQFEKNPLLLYKLAEVHQNRGDDRRAEEIAEQARKFNAREVLAMKLERPWDHTRVANALRDRGLFDWAREEYRSVKSLRPLATYPSLLATLNLAELLHDYQKEKEAGDVLGEVVTLMDENKHVERLVIQLGRDPQAVRSRAAYFIASDHGQQLQWEQQQEWLDKAIAHDPTDADVLIAMYRFEGADDAYRRRTLELIKEAADVFFQEIQAKPDSSTAYNQYAWLIGNTEGDYEQAVRYSHKSLELVPGAAGYLDTLGRCYYAKGDLENAVKHQARAYELEPHSQAIRRQYELFKKSMEDARK